jgi:Fe-S oxidoreductase
MTLEDLRSDMEMCHRCSACKFIPLERIKGFQHANACPSISKYNFHAYSGGGRIGIALAMLEKKIGYTKELLEIIYNCQMCGACDVSCKYGMDMEVLEPITESRIKCIEDGQAIPALTRSINMLEKQGTMLPGNKSRRADWAEGVDIKDFTEQKAEVVYHAGCRVCFDKDMWKIARGLVGLLQKAGVDVGIGRKHEACCSGRAYEMGFKEVFLRKAKENAELFRQSGVKTLVTGCSECYHAFKVLYAKFGVMRDLQVLHSTEYLSQLIRDAKLKPNNEVIATITYHDPCHLGRLGEPYISWKGERVPGHMYRFDPPKKYRRGTSGIFQPPRYVLNSIPGLKLVEMDRTREYSWCCGSGGGVKETNPEFAIWTARERIEEAESTGAEAIVTACPGCEKNLKDAVKESGSTIQVLDVVELLERAI